jgi:hypothetical protein
MAVSNAEHFLQSTRDAKKIMVFGLGFLGDSGTLYMALIIGIPTVYGSARILAWKCGFRLENIIAR